MTSLILFFLPYDPTAFERSIFTFGSLPLEHLTVREVGAKPVPLPAYGLLLLGAGPGVLSLRRRTKRAA